MDMSICRAAAEERPCPYRTPEQLRERMRDIAQQIREVRERLNARELLTGFLDDWAAQRPRQWIAELEQTVSDAQDNLCELERLEEQLSALAWELQDVRAAVGMSGGRYGQGAGR